MDEEREDRWEVVQDAVNSAREDLLRADADYLAAGAGGPVIERLAPYFDPARHRARVISEYARGLSEEIAGFDGARADLFERAAILSVNLGSTINAISIAMLQKAMQTATRIGRPGDDGAEAATFEKRMGALNELGLCIGLEYAWAMRLTERLISLRRAELAGYVAEVPYSDAEGLLRSFAEVAAEEGAMAIGEEILKNVVLAGLPVAAIVAGAVRVAQGIREKAKAMGKHYEVGPLDLMFELAERTDAERKLIEDIGSLLGALNDSFSEVARAVAAGPGSALTA